MHWRVSIFSQEEYSPEDPANPCVNYPTEEYESYADCDDHFVRSFLPPGLKPFWTVDNISEATDTFYLEKELYVKTAAYLGIHFYVYIFHFLRCGQIWTGTFPFILIRIINPF